VGIPKQWVSPTYHRKVDHHLKEIGGEWLMVKKFTCGGRRNLVPRVRNLATLGRHFESAIFAEQSDA
jgi:hypothetical protein